LDSSYAVIGHVITLSEIASWVISSFYSERQSELSCNRYRNFPSSTRTGGISFSAKKKEVVFDNPFFLNIRNRASRQIIFARTTNVNQRDNPTRCVFQKKFSHEKKSTNFDLIQISMEQLC